MDAKTFVDKVQAVSAEMTKKAETELATATPEEAKAILAKITEKAKGLVKQEEKDNAMKMVLDFCKSLASDDKALMEAVALLTKSPRMPSIPGVAKVAQPRVNRFMILDEAFPSVGAQIHEDALFAKYKLGRKDAYWLIADAIKYNKVPANRKWISFSPETWIYTYEAQGENPPEGWTGYVPRAPKGTVEAEAKTQTVEAASNEF
jgi:hypothetical protein